MSHYRRAIRYRLRETPRETQQRGFGAWAAGELQRAFEAAWEDAQRAFEAAWEDPLTHELTEPTGVVARDGALCRR